MLSYQAERVQAVFNVAVRTRVAERDDEAGDSLGRDESLSCGMRKRQ